MNKYVIQGRIVSNGLPIPGKDIDVKIAYISAIGNIPAKEKITIADDGTFIFPLSIPILGVATTVEEILDIINTLKISINGEKYEKYDGSVKIIGSKQVPNEVINGQTKLIYTNATIWVGDLGDILIKETPPTPQTIIKGTVLDETGTPLSGATVNIISSPPKPSLSDLASLVSTVTTQGTGGIINNPPQLPEVTTPINETITTKDDGTWEYKVSTTDVKPKDLSITFSKDEKELKTISSPQQTSFTPETNATVIEIPRITLLTPPDISSVESKKVEQEVKTEENKTLREQINTTLPPQDKLVNSINLKKEDIKRLLIPFVISLLIPFGAAAVQGITSKLPIDQIKSLVKCPSAAFITDLINKRNKLVTQINNIYSTVKLLTSVLAGTNIVITAIQVGINAIGLVPSPPGTPGSVVIAANNLSKALEKAQITVSVLTLSLASFGVILGTIINLLNSLDIILQYCAQDNNMNFEKINDEINALANPTIVATQSEDNTYKGFTLSVKIDQTNESQYIKRYAVATNKQGVDVLKTDSSFASDPIVLIDQLKFIIDLNPSITAE
jgi:hypothetical protein